MYVLLCFGSYSVTTRVQLPVSRRMRLTVMAASCASLWASSCVGTATRPSMKRSACALASSQCIARAQPRPTARPRLTSWTMRTIGTSVRSGSTGWQRYSLSLSLSLCLHNVCTHKAQNFYKKGIFDCYNWMQFNLYCCYVTQCSLCEYKQNLGEGVHGWYIDGKMVPVHGTRSLVILIGLSLGVHLFM